MQNHIIQKDRWFSTGIFVIIHLIYEIERYEQSTNHFANIASNAAVDVSGYEVNAGVMFWDIKGDRLSIGVAATGYYVGFGINDKGPRMAGADLALCREFQVGEWA